MNNREEQQLKLTKFPKEGFMSSMITTPEPKKIVWRPNNYRRKLDILNSANSVKKIPNHTIDSTTYSQHTKILYIKNYMPNITMMVCKKNLIAIYSQTRIGNKKETFFIERSTTEELEKRINEKKKKIERKLDKALYKYAAQNKLSIPYKKPIWLRHEDFIKGEEYIDKIPRETVIHDTVFKKVYPEGIEFIGGKNKEPTVSLKNYIKNRAIEDISPQIASELRDFHYTTGKLLAEFSTQIRLHLAVLNNIDGSFKKFNKLISQKRLSDFQ